MWYRGPHDQESVRGRTQTRSTASRWRSSARATAVGHELARARREPARALPPHADRDLGGRSRGPRASSSTATWRELTAADGPVLVEPVRPATRCATRAAARPACAPGSRRPAGWRSSWSRAPARRSRASTTRTTCRPACAAPRGSSDFALRFRDETVMCSPPPAVQAVRAPGRRAADPALASALKPSHSSASPL